MGTLLDRGVRWPAALARSPLVRSGDAALARRVVALAWPAILHMFLVTLVFLVSRALVGRYSAAALASLQISGTLVWTAYSVGTAFSAGTLAVVARSIGAGDRNAAARAARGSMALALGLGLAVTIPALSRIDAYLDLLFPGSGAAVHAEARAYLEVSLLALPLSFLEAAAAASLQGAGDTRTPLLAAVAGNVLHLLLAPALLFGLAGAPRMGVRGAALAAALAVALEAALLVYCLLRRGSPLPLRRAGAPLFGSADRAELRRVLRVGAPALLEKVVYHGRYVGFVAIIGALGAVAMAANQALVGIEAVCFLSADGLGIAAAAVVAQRLGAGEASQASRAAWLASAMAIALLSFFGILFALAPRLLMLAFTSDAAIVETGVRCLYVAAAAQPFMAFATVMGMSLRGAGATRSVLAVTLASSLAVRVGATYLFAIPMGLGLVGVWLGSTADWATRSLLFACLYLHGGWRRTRV